MSVPDIYNCGTAWHDCQINQDQDEKRQPYRIMIAPNPHQRKPVLAAERQSAPAGLVVAKRLGATTADTLGDVSIAEIADMTVVAFRNRIVSVSRSGRHSKADTRQKRARIGRPLLLMCHA